MHSFAPITAALLAASASAALAGELSVSHRARTSSGDDSTSADAPARAFTIGSDEEIAADSLGSFAISYGAGAINRYGSGRVSAAVIGQTDRNPSSLDRQASATLFATDAIVFDRAPDDPSTDPISVTVTCAVSPLGANLGDGFGDGTNNAIGPGGSAFISLFASSATPDQAGSTVFALNDGFTQLVGGTFSETFEVQPGGEIEYFLNLSATARIGINNVDRPFGQDGRYFGYTITVETEPGTLAASESGHDYTTQVPPPDFPCNAADLADPAGLLDLADIVAFVTAFTATDPAADLNADGVFDLGDITVFVEAFNRGCP